MSRFYFLPSYGAASCAINEFQDVNLINLYRYAGLVLFALKGDCVLGNQIGLNRMHPDRSSCLSLSGNGSMV